MKILFLDLYYSDFLDDYYKKYPEKKCENYENQKKAVLSECFGTADFYSKNLEKLGHNAENIILNNEILQKQWAKENDIKYFASRFNGESAIGKYFKKKWTEKILEAQIAKYKPDVLYCKNVYLPGIKFLKKIKKHTKLIVAQAAYKLPPKNFFTPYDLMISSLPNCVKLFRGWGIKSEYLPLAFEKTILDKLKKNISYNITHIGGYSPIHNERNKTLEAVAKNNTIDFWGYGTDNLDENSPIKNHFHGEAWGLDMYDILYNSKITLTKHIKKVAQNYANNMTLYEATGCGCLLIADTKDNLSELFEVGKEIETYSNDKELSEKINYYLSHEEERKKIAKAGQKRTLEDHTYEKRTQELISIINKYIK
ncbi:glycosyltransferase family 1 protein [Candidatus Parcubacteria bacterium]|nr:glycosyltransferase family 1 protein [Candidatus Parcubacteria bacterium]